MEVLDELCRITKSCKESMTSFSVDKPYHFSGIFMFLFVRLDITTVLARVSRPGWLSWRVWKRHGGRLTRRGGGWDFYIRVSHPRPPPRPRWWSGRILEFHINSLNDISDIQIYPVCLLHLGRKCTWFSNELLWICTFSRGVGGCLAFFCQRIWGVAYTRGRLTRASTVTTVYFKGTAFEKINKHVEDFVNETKEFPDYQDLFDLVQTCNGKYYGSKMA